LAHDLRTLFNELPAATFVERYFHQLPVAVPHGAEHLKELGTLQVLDTIAALPDANVRRSRGGEWWPGGERPGPDDLRRSLAEGWTIFVRHAERFYPPLAELARSFQCAFESPIDVHFFCTPPETEGFGWHYDAEDVFIVQTHGSKLYRLRKNTVNPWPLVETTPDDLTYEAERSLAMECRLKAGDWLYIPPGYWHATRAEELSISLSIGVMSATGIDLLEVLRPLLVQSLRWRQRLPLTSEFAALSEAEVRDRLQLVFGGLGRELAEQLSSVSFLEQYQRWRSKYGAPG
jgi:ribosomal protein L16 Arg81 hydroxylase